MVLKILLLGLIIVVPIHYFLVQPFIVPDDVMSPKYRKGDILLIDRISYFRNLFSRDDIVLVRNDKEPGNKFLRRLIGMPNERVIINDGILTIRGDGKLMKELPLFGSVFSSLKDIGDLDAHEYFIIGDTSLENGSGMIDERNIVGKPLYKLWPL
jgi:signal peptidase I